MAIPKFDEFMPLIITFLGDGEIHSLKEIVTYCIDAVELDEEDLTAVLSSGDSIVRNRIGWAKTYLKKAGLIESPKRAHFCLSEAGKVAFKCGADCVTLDYLKQFDSFRTFYNQNSQIDSNETCSMLSDKPEPESPFEKIETALKVINDELIEDLMKEIMDISWDAFERLVVKLLLAMGYGKLEENKDSVTKKTGDGGIDGIVRADKFGFDSIYVQAKQWRENVHTPEIQKFIGALAVTSGATKGIFITTSDFSKHAVEMVAKNITPQIILVNGKHLVRLMIEYNLGVSVVTTYQIKRIDYDFFNEDL